MTAIEPERSLAPLKLRSFANVAGAYWHDALLTETTISDISLLRGKRHGTSCNRQTVRTSPNWTLVPLHDHGRCARHHFEQADLGDTYQVSERFDGVRTC